jgi:quercetin dioxygenase-like cupin family protein
MRRENRIDRRSMIVAAFTAAAASGEPSGLQAEVLLSATSSWDGAPYPSYPSGVPQLTVRKITIPAHGELEWHAHPMPSAAYVVSGEITVVAQSNGKRQHFSAGQVIPETVNSGHRGFVGDTPAVFIVFYAGATGLPLSTSKV